MICFSRELRLDINAVICFRRELRLDINAVICFRRELRLDINAVTGFFRAYSNIDIEKFLNGINIGSGV